MDKELEEIIVKAFFAKRIQQRILFEFYSPQKREDAIHRLCHDYSVTLREEFMIEIPKPNSSPVEIENLLKKQGAGSDCYAISWNGSIDGKHLELRSALEKAVGSGSPSIISCISGKLAYFEAGIWSPAKVYFEKVNCLFFWYPSVYKRLVHRGYLYGERSII